ncbi:TOM1-like protein 6 [Vitis vinifera]|uniref:TOM1-like protein 6 n=1 Tax=Vitis vinifera TaxID=29760 RepID=A0A438IVI0_VITVI|nr:TOM1-like protein 6 [Vitis vinifera]
MSSPFSSSSSSSSSATVRVEKATSDLLIGPDWTMNIDICDTINSNHWQAKEVVKAVKRRLQHKNPKVQLLALTLVETMVKNCGDYVHFQITERAILQEMIKIVKKKPGNYSWKVSIAATAMKVEPSGGFDETPLSDSLGFPVNDGCIGRTTLEADMQVREKILALLDSWQEAFGGPGGKHPQYYWAYEELRRAGVEFPKRSLDAAPIFTPPVTHPIVRHPQSGYGMPSNSTRRLDEAMASEMESVSLASMDSMQEVMQLLADMLQAVDPSDHQAVKDEVIVDLVNQCRANQKRLMQMLTSTGDEELLGRGLELNDGLQSLLAKHDAILSGSPLPNLVTNFSPQQPDIGSSSLKPAELKETLPRSNADPSTPVAAVTKVQAEEEEDEEDDFAQLARRHSKTRATPSQSTSTGTSDSTNITTSITPASSTSDPSNALAVVPVSPAPVKTTKEQDMIDLLSLTLSTISTSHETQPPSSASNPSLQQVPVSTTTQEYPYSSAAYSGNQGQVPYSNYVVPWAQPQQTQSQPQPQPQPQPQIQPRTQYPQYSYGYPPPPWAATLVILTKILHPLQYNSFSSKGNNGLAMNGDGRVPGPRNPVPASGNKPFIPSYRLFEDLNVLGNTDGRLKMTSSASPSLSGTSSQGMVGGRK